MSHAIVFIKIPLCNVRDIRAIHVQVSKVNIMIVPIAPNASGVKTKNEPIEIRAY